ncbi:uncharacterized protein LOC111623587 [Centruroides sculpturatus]|uniref:uncharacterized protein LOC111623587 n=1 Tax=Centruroides sculpturatus TaxID=218467 RepID=UPI000C6E2C5C|nr:uncharacterized protein LOC111623587 [Centruroides sculpturatus]
MKYNIFKMYINKIRQRTSEIKTQEKEEEEIIKMFMLNDYPKSLLNKWLKKLEIDKQSNLIDKEKSFVKIRYIPKIFERIKKILNSKINLIPEKVNTTKNHLCYRNQGNYDILEEKGVVYSFNCSCKPEKIYIGETKRKLKIRINEHIRAIKRNYANSVVAEHCNNTGCEIVLNSVKIKKKEKNNYKRQLYEHMYIIRQNNRINSNNGREIHQSWLRFIEKGVCPKDDKNDGKKWKRGVRQTEREQMFKIIVIAILLIKFEYPVEQEIKENWKIVRILLNILSGKILKCKF